MYEFGPGVSQVRSLPPSTTSTAASDAKLPGIWATGSGGFGAGRLVAPGGAVVVVVVVVVVVSPVTAAVVAGGRIVKPSIRLVTTADCRLSTAAILIISSRGGGVLTDGTKPCSDAPISVSNAF